jgi:spermidine synthase
MSELTPVNDREVASDVALLRGPAETDAESRATRWYFGFFLVSGFCGLVYQVTWLRLAMASFGVNAPVAAIVISLFMAGLGLGSVAGGKLISRIEPASPVVSLRLYALCELVIACSAVAVPALLDRGRALLDSTLQALAWGSLAYYLCVGAYLAVVLLPWCFCMGATTPLAMAAIRSMRRQSPRAFSYLYLANVIGATVGTLISAFFLIELLGFIGTLWAVGALNAAIGLTAFGLSLRAKAATPVAHETHPSPLRLTPAVADRGALWLLFTSGLTSMGMEIVWIRQFTPYLGTVVYAFASVLAIYLMATAVGTWLYRARARDLRGVDDRNAWSAVALFGLLPLLACDPRLPFGFRLDDLAPLRVAFGIMPFCVGLGFLTPSLVDRWSLGDPRRAGFAYGINVLGSIIGPLVSGFLLLPRVDERVALQLLVLPLFAASLLRRSNATGPATGVSWLRSQRPLGIALIASALLVLVTKSYADLFTPKEIRRDYEATVIATGEGMRKQLLVNGYGMTALTPITKVMAHLPLGFLDRPPGGVLVIAFGMGTTFRSALTWQIPTTAVDLVPSVPALFGYFHPDASEILGLPFARVVIDDGRRFLKEGAERYDVIIVDPPPPSPAVASSLLYSVEFYDLAKRRLKPGGILAQWLPGDAGSAIESSATQAITHSFPYVRVFRSVENWGHHFLASNSPIPLVDAATLAGRMPQTAVSDLIEWGPEWSAERQLQRVLTQEVSPQALIGAAPRVPPLQDTRPVNEYFYVRNAFPQFWSWWGACCLQN